MIDFDFENSKKNRIWNIGFISKKTFVKISEDDQELEYKV
jgi:hypothetical protein